MESESPTGSPSRKSKFYTTLAWVMLFLMAFTWSLDSSFNAIFAGAAVVFFIFAYANKPVDPRASYSRAQTSSRGDATFSENLKSSFQKKQFSQPSSTIKTSLPSSSTSQKAKIVIGIIAFVSFIFIMIIIVIVASDDDSDNMIAKDIVDQAQRYYENNQYDSAYRYYKLALVIEPENTDALLGYGNTLYVMKYPDSTMMYYDKALAVNPDYDLARYNKGWVHYDRHDYDKAKSELEALLKKNPSYYDAMLLLGDVYFNQGNHVQALHWYEQGYNNGQRTVGLLTQLGDLYVEGGKTQDAIARYKESLQYDTANVKVYQRLGELVPGKDGNEYRTRAAMMQQ